MLRTAPTWDQLGQSSALTAQKELRALQEKGYGAPNYKMPLRLFDAPLGTKPRITFYHDHNVWCPFCETLWLYLEEKRIPYEAVTVNKEPHGKEGGSTPKEIAYWKMGARGVPGFQIDGGRLYSGANLMVIEQVFHDHNPLVPDEDDPAADRWATMDALSQAFSWVPITKADAPHKRVVDLPEYKSFMLAADELNEALGAHGGPFLLGAKISILDVQMARSAARVAAMLPYFKGVQVRRNPRWPHIEKWYTTMEARPTYGRITADFYTHFSATPLQVPFLVGPKHPDAAEMAAKLDGMDGSWSLPLPEDDGTLLEPVAPFGQSSQEARGEAAERVVHNARALAGFCARGLKDAHAQQYGSRDHTYATKYGKAIPPTQSGAEVGSTNLGSHYGGSDALVATPEVMSDILLRHCVDALLHGPTEHVRDAISSHRFSLADAKACLGYLRDRISVPRDMGGPAARQLRAHLNWVVSAVEGCPVHTESYARPSKTPKQADVM